MPGKWEKWRDWRLLISILYRIQHLALHVTCHTFTRTALRHETHTRRISTAKFISRSRAMFQSTEYGIGRLTVVLFSRLLLYYVPKCGEIWTITRHETHKTDEIISGNCWFVNVTYGDLEFRRWTTFFPAGYWFEEIIRYPLLNVLWCNEWESNAAKQDWYLKSI